MSREGGTQAPPAAWGGVESSKAARGDSASGAARGCALGIGAACGGVLGDDAVRGGLASVEGWGGLRSASNGLELAAGLRSASNGLEPAQRGGIPATTRGCDGPIGVVVSRNSKSAEETGWECCSAEGKEDSSKIT